MNQILISIIVPVYNCEKYLEKCIYSILNQTIENIEIILVNDGSKDNSLKICENIKSVDRRVRIISKSNEGVSKARNVGIDNAIGKYLMFCDADDYVEKEWCQSLYERINFDNKLLAIGGLCFINQRNNENTVNNKVFSIQEEVSYIGKDSIFEIYDSCLLNSPCNKMYNNKLIKDSSIRFDEKISLGEDLLFNLEYIECINTDIVIVNKSEYIYFLREEESLDNKYYENLYEIYRYLFLKLETKLEIFGADMNKIREKLYKSYRVWLIKAIKNYYGENCEYSWDRKIKNTIKIIFSYDFIKCLKNSRVIKDIILKITR